MNFFRSYKTKNFLNLKLFAYNNIKKFRKMWTLFFRTSEKYFNSYRESEKFFKML